VTAVRSVIAATVLLLVFVARADLIVLYDSGQSWPIDRYLAPLLSEPPDSAAPPQPPAAPASQSDFLEALLPIRSPSLSPGRVTARAFLTPVPVAMFLIGTDEQSLRWLEQHRAYLIEQNAVGLLVSADDEQDLRAVAEVGNGLSITPASGEDIARLLNTKHYPLAVTEGRIWQ